MLDPLLETLPLALVTRPLDTGVALDTRLGHEQHHPARRQLGATPVPRSYISDPTATLGHARRSWLANDPAGTLTPRSAMPSLTRLPQTHESDSCGAPNDWR